MRLIDADALMADLEKWLKQIDPTHPPEDNSIPPMEDIIVSTLMTIEEQPIIEPQKVGGWIPVTEALPEEKQDVLLAFKHNMVVGFWEDILNDGGQAWYANSGNGWFTGTEAVDDDGFPLAWMPLPEPYKEGQDE